jgi:hypothetical protein
VQFKQLVSVMAFVVLASACGGSASGSDERIAELEQQIADLQAQLVATTATASAPAKTEAGRKLLSGAFMLLKDGPLDDSFIGGTGGIQCIGQGGYDDLKYETQVRVLDQSGVILGVTQLGNGEGVREGRAIPTICRWEFSVDVPADRDFYSVEVSDRRRGQLSYSRSDLDSTDWYVEISIGP